LLLDSHDPPHFIKEGTHITQCKHGEFRAASMLDETESYSDQKINGYSADLHA
jgi:hypothetical protein